MAVCWLNFIAEGKTPAKLRALGDFSGINKGEFYQCWEELEEYYRIWNSKCNNVRVPKSIFEIIDDGDVLNQENNMRDEKQRLDAIDKREAEEKALNKRADETYESRERTSDILESIYGDEADAHWFDCMFFKLMNSKSNIGEAAEAVEELRTLADKHAYQLGEKEDE